MSDPILEPAIGTVDGSNTAFETSVAYWPGTLRVYLNGQLIRETDVDGPTETGGKTFSMGSPPLTDDRVDAWYRTDGPTPGAFVPPPIPHKAVNLRPEPRAIADLRPVPQSAEGAEAVEYIPRASKAVELTPEALSIVDLRPTPVRAEEV